MNIKGLIFFLLLSTMAQAQIYNPVKWVSGVKKITDTEYELIATAIIEDDWHLYSQNVADDGPIPTSFLFKGSENYLRKGNTKEENGIEVFDQIFNMKIKYFSNKASFRQRVRIKNFTTFKINAQVEFMVCNDEQCLPPKEVDLVFIIP